MPVKTKRWDDPADPDDGHRLLVCRYRPRGIAKANETWDAWDANLGPSVELHAAAYGKRGLAINFNVYRNRYLTEMRSQKPRVVALAERVKAGETITLLCSSQCDVESRCHRSLLKALIERAAATHPPDAESHPPQTPSE